MSLTAFGLRTGAPHDLSERYPALLPARALAGTEYPQVAARGAGHRPWRRQTSDSPRGAWVVHSGAISS